MVKMLGAHRVDNKIPLMRKKTIKIPLYQGEVTLIKTDDLKEVEKKYKTQSLHGYDACVLRDGHSQYIIAFTNNIRVGIIAHEALHLIGYIYEDIGAILDVKNDEPQCYLLEWIVDECHKFIKIDKSNL